MIAIPSPVLPHRPSVPYHVRAVVVLLSALLALSPSVSLASYEWCSRDPGLILQRPGALTPNALDLQVQVPLQVSTTQDEASLTVVLPKNVDYHEIDASTAAFPLTTVFKPILASATSDAYRVLLTADVSDNQGQDAVPAQLVVTNPVDASSVTCTGRPGQRVSAWVQFAPFVVNCG